ncbi:MULTISPECIES: hypothetical protein [unclassified Chelatococcus]|uniref:hypothetical protein n=1 Tax=unclassified Chelatococcus TaxID=2638111 RepID=UPI001BCB433D|nr:MULTISPECIES: hypothetical protein [unclassified Chelatococcus]MBS7699160.1 hypothetical protein [Chelatococcus sp. YT9]MBX3554941.1 hypothetical protein [Chelatococcus sp.]
MTGLTLLDLAKVRMPAAFCALHAEASTVTALSARMETAWTEYERRDAVVLDITRDGASAQTLREIEDWVDIPYREAKDLAERILDTAPQSIAELALFAAAMERAANEDGLAAEHLATACASLRRTQIGGSRN